MLIINPNKVITAFFQNENKNSGESWDISETHGNKGCFIVGYDNNYPIIEKVDVKDEIHFHEICDKLGLKIIP